MEIIKIEELTFKYLLKDKPALVDINLSIKSGDFVLICGKSGCGKSTLLKHLKPTLIPHGDRKGAVFYKGKRIEDISERKAAEELGYVYQNPENQLVTDKVWHELAFGLENLGYDNDAIRVRVSEMASYFGIEKWFYKDVTELSGGEKQTLNLASVMAMNPRVLILDEPTSQLDPIAANEFLDTIEKINKDLGVTVILTEHRLDKVFSMADKVLVMEKGKVITYDKPKNIGAFLKKSENDMFLSLPTATKIYAEVVNDLDCPITLRDGRRWLQKLLKDNERVITEIEAEDKIFDEKIIEIREVWFKYDKHSENVVKDFSLTVHKGEFYSILGGNGTGKTTSLNLISGINKPYRGKVYIKGKDVKKYSSNELFNKNLGVLPQNPQTIFVKNTVREDLMEILFDVNIKEEEKERKLSKISQVVEINDILDMHPYDLSGGEAQKAALAKVLMLEPEILLLDEPTKALDNHYKEKFGEILKRLQCQGKTIIMVTHDLEFAAEYSDTCGMFFDGNIVTSGVPKKFFSENNFYTTSANKISRYVFKGAVTCKDVISLCRKNL
ncbi:ABC transporter ATP-binding protein [Clostridium cibarium]|uniref:Energy-coupling factor ABC transporter ATP-binding protein n=1 Tax=Clostridium cibarium TaxID=2762247 RepID=A0ABR8PP47_9CLOT|nr:ABC transporter ATP-binding protein [Clostridium cibarium]MBD7909930.1 energy-coupling factor ABC transporter ATP-binding protein [Clostridium cibarium]